MLWRKYEHLKKIVLKRKMPGGKLHVRTYFERDLPPPDEHPVGTIFCLTRRRLFWRFRLWMPLESTYFTLNEQGRWVQMCRTLH